MRLNRILLFSLLVCFVFPALSYADQLEDAKAAIQNNEFKKAYELLLPLAEENNAEAQTILGAMYINGQGVEQDYTKGLSLIMNAGRMGYEPARVRALGSCLELAKQGDTAAMYNVGLMCLNKWGGEQDANDCIGWLETAAKLGHVRSGSVLSQIYTKNSYGITPDKEKASYWDDMAKGFAAGFDGTWTGTSSGMDGKPMTVTYKFQEDGDVLTGTMSGGPDKGIPIKDGIINGTKISFAVDVVFNKMIYTNYYTGLLLGNDLQLSFIVEGAPEPTTFVAKRVR
ncbi:MAG: SEL1-like repeat protein [Deltaproteobacteria bacterium]|nr:SEL1-like repeat protein [Deltaproteobacteria bacterium]